MSYKADEHDERGNRLSFAPDIAGLVERLPPWLQRRRDKALRPQRMGALWRFMTYVEPVPESGCWLWTGAVNEYGYGNFWNSRQMKAHRFAYEQYVGPIPDGMVLDHLCRIPCCVNPRHLEPVTTKENLRRSDAPSAIAGRRTHCIRGHEYTPENTQINTKPNGNKRRVCRTCMRERKR